MFRALAGRLLLIAVTIVLPLASSLTMAPIRAGADIVCADLVVTDITVTPSTPIEDQNAAIAVTVKNQGSCDATGFVTQWQPSQNAVPAGSSSLPSLAAGASAVLNFTYAFPNDGNFLTIATVDSGDAVPETRENNNTAILSVTVVPKTTDLQITSVTFVPNPAVATDAMQAIVHVINVGNTAASDFQVEWKPSPTTSAVTQLVNGLAAFGAGVDVTFDYTYPFAGTFDTTATVDSLHDIQETNEGNNTFTESLTVDPALPDLIVQNITINPPSPVAGQPMTLTATIANVGHRPAGDFEVDWTPVLGQKLQQQVIGPLAVGATVDVTFTYTFDRGGSFDTTVSADSTNKVREVNEDNNNLDVQVGVGTATVDLTITDFEESPSPPVQGTDTTFTVKVKNLGNTTSGSFVVAVNPDSTGISSNGKQTVSQQVDSLAPNTEVTLTFHFQYPDPGNFRAIAQVDVLKNVSETNEANNTALLNLVVQPGDIDLVVTSFNLTTDLCAQAVPNGCSPMKIWKGTATTANITVVNNGSFPAGAFSVMWLLHETDTRGPTEALAGLLPGQSATVHIHGSYAKDGTFNTFAVVDPFNQVKEGAPGGETNNTSAPTSAPLNPILVLPRDTTVDVSMPNFYVFNDLDGITGDGEWNMWFMALSPNDKCHISFSVINFDLKGFKCSFFYREPDDGDDEPYIDGSPGSGDEVGPGPTLTLTLTETQPLVLVIFGIEDDLPLGVDKPGTTNKFWLPGDYQVATGKTILKGQKGESDCPNNGECFDAAVQVAVTNGPPPPAASSTSIASNLAAHNALTRANSAIGMFNALPQTDSSQ